MRGSWKFQRSVLAAAAVLALAVAPLPAGQSPAAPPEFQLARLAYTDVGSSFGFGRRRGGSWLTDAPEAEQHLMQGVTRLTRLLAAPDSVAVRPIDAELFDHPFLYAVEVGQWDLSDADAAALRQYLLRGGFLMVDDFHGSAEWEVFMESLRRVFPDRPVVDIEGSAEVFHVLYDLDQRVQIPGIAALSRGVTYERDGTVPHWRGVFDDQGRLMVAINHNMDLGDAWELADEPYYPQPLTALAYRFAINYILYAMSH